MTDSIFGELKQEGYYLTGEQTLTFGGVPCPIEVLINLSIGQTEIAQIQRETFQCFMDKWPALQSELIEALIRYYNEEERFAYGPEDEEELAEWWPEIETKEALLQAVTIESIVIPREPIMDIKGGRCVYLLFSRSWGGEDWDDNGIGVCILNEEIDEIAYKDIAF